jgi:uncharacterized protein (UPF0332 family)
LKKAEKELGQGQTHRGLIKAKPDIKKAEEHIAKAEHYLKATDCLKKNDFSDISAGTIFYSMYHCLLAIAAKFGYESRNQECTFALISALIEDKKIDFEQSMLDKIYRFGVKEDDKTSLKIREQYQYGTELSLKDEDIYNMLVLLAKEVLLRSQEIIKSQK